MVLPLYLLELQSTNQCIASYIPLQLLHVQRWHRLRKIEASQDNFEFPNLQYMSLERRERQEANKYFQSQSIKYT